MTIFAIMLAAFWAEPIVKVLQRCQIRRLSFGVTDRENHVAAAIEALPALLVEEPLFLATALSSVDHHVLQSSQAAGLWGAPIGFCYRSPIRPEGADHRPRAPQTGERRRTRTGDLQLRKLLLYPTELAVLRFSLLPATYRPFLTAPQSVSGNEGADCRRRHRIG